VIPLLGKRGREVAGDDRVEGPIAMGQAQMPDSGLKVAKLAMERAQHRVERGRVAAIGQGALTDAHRFRETAGTGSGHGFADCSGGLVVKNGDCGHPGCLAQMRSGDSLGGLWLGSKRKGRRVFRPTAQIYASCFV
jgi:hypothetical protein